MKKKSKLKFEFTKDSIQKFILGIFLCLAITIILGTLVGAFIWLGLLQHPMSMLARAIYYPSIFLACMIGNFIIFFLKDKVKK